MTINGNDLSIIESGWYQDDMKFGEMDDDETYPNFELINIFQN